MSSRDWDDPWRKYPASKPLKAEGGIATSKQRGAMAATWWSKRFVEVLESYGLGTRMQRGRRYARSGQVLNVAVTPGLLVSQVQGSRRTPYVVTVRGDQPTDAQWSRLDEALRSQLRFAARLLAGEVPPELETACADAGISLFPTTWRSLQATCSCPDWENPCKHIAAVLYVFADQLDSDPWLLLAWRGRTREQILGYLAEGRSAAAAHGRADGLPAWWPLTPGRTAGPSGRWETPIAAAPEPAHRVLARLEPLDDNVAGTPAGDLLIAAYTALVISDAEPNLRP
jgi:uncharacterized Zn finger protein